MKKNTLNFPDLEGVNVPFVLPEAYVSALATRGLIAHPGEAKEFFHIYQAARKANVPVLITSDSLLHTYHVLFDRTLRNMEQTYFLPLLKHFNMVFLVAAHATYEALADTAWEKAAEQVLAYFGVAARLLNPNLATVDTDVTASLLDNRICTVLRACQLAETHALMEALLADSRLKHWHGSLELLKDLEAKTSSSQVLAFLERGMVEEGMKEAAQAIAFLNLLGEHLNASNPLRKDIQNLIADLEKSPHPPMNVDNVAFPPHITARIERELNCIRQGTRSSATSAIFSGPNYAIRDAQVFDYTQYIPRGHYTRHPDLEAYFRCTMWYGQTTFRFSVPQELRAGLLLLDILRSTDFNQRRALDAWDNTLYKPTAFLVGASDDVTPHQVNTVLETVYGADAEFDTLLNESKLPDFKAALDKLPAPRIENGDSCRNKGLRLMGQRFVLDAYIFQNLIYSKVGTQKHRRGLPKGLDVMATLGSERAYAHLKHLRETQYANYATQLAELRTWVASLPETDWTATTYNHWLHTLRPLLKPPDTTAPAFMQSTAWLDKQLQTALGYWTELKHDTLLYIKQVNSSRTGTPRAKPPDPAPARGYVEPVPDVYARLAHMITRLHSELAARGLISQKDTTELQKLAHLTQTLHTIAKKELNSVPLTQDEYECIHGYGEQLKEWAIGPQRHTDEEIQAALVADVATDPDTKRVLETAIGRVNPLYAVVPLVEEDGRVIHQVAMGGIYSYYEFTQPLNQRLTNAQWRARLEQEEAPPPPHWVASFLTPELPPPQMQAVQACLDAFRWALVETFFYLDLQKMPARATVDRAPLAEYVATLKARQHYEGRQIQRVSYRACEWPTPTTAQIVTEEVWRDWLYQSRHSEPSYNDLELGTRGPYTLHCTYTLERDAQNAWHVTGYQPQGQHPAWVMDPNPTSYADKLRQAHGVTE